jgi:DNA-directed RNA polymerase subunit RPC12/RpoP
MTKFCFNCGHKLEYKFNPPNFCPNCGTNINETSSKKDEDIPACKTSIPSKASETSDGYTDSAFVPNISSLQYELDDLWGKLSANHRFSRRKASPQKKAE